MDFAIRIVNSVLNLPIGFLGNSHYRKIVINPPHQGIKLVEMTFGLTRQLQAVKLTFFAPCLYDRLVRNYIPCLGHLREKNYTLPTGTSPYKSYKGVPHPFRFSQKVGIHIIILHVINLKYIKTLKKYISVVVQYYPWLEMLLFFGYCKMMSLEQRKNSLEMSGVSSP